MVWTMFVTSGALRSLICSQQHIPRAAPLLLCCRAQWEHPYPQLTQMIQGMLEMLSVRAGAVSRRGSPSPAHGSHLLA